MKDIHQRKRFKKIIVERLESLPARICSYWTKVFVGLRAVRSVYLVSSIRQCRMTYGTWMAPESQLTAFNLNESVL